MYGWLQVLDIMERYKAKKKQKEEESLMMMRGDYDVPVGGERRPDVRFQLHGYMVTKYHYARSAGDSYEQQCRHPCCVL